jgi:hypothetical protein
MKAQRFAVPATLFAAGAFSAPAHAVQFVDIAASDAGTPIDLVGDGVAEYFFYSNYGGSDYAIEGKAFSGNAIGPVSATAYYPSAADSTQVKTQTTTGADGYYGLTFSDFSSTGSSSYTGYALVDRGGSHISEIDFRAVDAAGAVPEPETWAMMILGLGLTGAAMRHRRKAAALVAA